MRLFFPGLVCSLLLLCCGMLPARAQFCSTLGQTPSTAFPVCGTTTFHQGNVPGCTNGLLFVPGCTSGTGPQYRDLNPFWYKFTCFQSGTLGFVLNPLQASDDYDWQLYDITGLDPDEVYTNRDIIVTGNWSGKSGSTGTSASGVGFIQCASSGAADDPTSTFAKMPQIIEGHEYMLMVSNYSSTQQGYDLSFIGGTAVITDPVEPHLEKADPDCDGASIIVKLNRKVKCNSLTLAGSEFTIFPANVTVVSAAPVGCSSAFDFDELALTLSAPLPPGDYQLIIRDGTDANTLMDNCDRPIPAAESVDFNYFIPQPIFADSVRKPGCAPQSIDIHFPKKILCNTIAADGSDFIVTGPFPVTVTSANANCVNGESNIVTVNFATPVHNEGTYTVTLRAGIDGSTIIDECGIELPVHSRSFETKDTVSARFAMATTLGCRQNSVTFSHDGAHDVNSWSWVINNGTPVGTQQHTQVFSATSTNNIELTVSNGVCSHTYTEPLVMDNEVIARFDMPAIICPEDPLRVVNNTQGLVDTWRWEFGITNSNVKDPAPIQYPMTNREAFHNIKLVATNNTLGCSDSVRKQLRVLNNCFIAVPSAFTPNGDGLNDFLYPNNAIKALDMEFRVFNRWGQMVFMSREWTRKWDGKINGVLQSPGVFVWFLTYTHADTGEKVFQKGTTTLIL